MVAQFFRGLGLAAFVALGVFDDRKDSPATDSLREGIRLLEEDDRFGKSNYDIDAKVRRSIVATEALARAVSTMPNDPTARAWYALALLKTLEKDDALREAEEAVRLGPQAALAYRVRGLVHAEHADHEKALADFTKAVQLDPRDAASLRARGEFFADRHQTEKAFADYAAALKINSRDAKTYFSRAMLHAEAANVDLALKDLDAAILAQPDVPELRGLRGFIRMYKKDYAGVVEDLGRALEDRPDQEMFAMRGIALTNLNRHEEAIRNFDDAIRFQVDAVLLIGRSLSYQKLGRLDRALQDADEAVKMKPDAASFGARALLLQKLGRLEKATDDMGEAIRQEPKNTTYRTIRGGMLHELGRDEAALADYDEAVRLEPDKLEPHYLRGIGRLIAGHEGAGDDFRAVLRLKGWRHAVSADCALDAYAVDLLARRPAEARAFLEQALTRCDQAAWPYPLLRCLHGDIKEADALAAAPGDPERTEARIWLSIQRITDGRRDAGLRELKEICDKGDPHGTNIDIARAVLQREMGNPPRVPK